METFIRNNEPIIKQELYKLAVHAVPKNYVVSNVIRNDNILLAEVILATESIIKNIENDIPEGKFAINVCLNPNSCKNLKVIIQRVD